jgi:Ca-activated chloride channel homolog
MKILIIISVNLFLLSGLKAQQRDNAEIFKGNEAYKKQDYNKAQQAYQKVLEQNPKNAFASFNLGNALFRDNKAEEAEKEFDATIEYTDNKKLQADAHYNKGVTLTKQKKTAESVVAYKDALKLNPDDSLARENLQRALNELRSQQENNKKDQKQKEEKQQNKLNKKQVMQLLNALQEQEKMLQQKLQKSKVPAPGQPEKDW